MKSENKNRWMVWAIVILAIMNITTILTIIYHQNQSEKPAYISTPLQDISESASINYSGRYFRDQLNLSNEQMKSFVSFNPAFRQRARNINIDLENLRNKMLTELAAKKPDIDRLNLLSDSIGYQHISLKKLTYNYYLDIKKICNPDQQKKLEQLFREMFKSDTQIGHNGMGGQGGRRFGKRNIN
jgi:hypothetical protein